MASYATSVKCTGCGGSKCSLTSHPLLDVPVCANCLNNYNCGEFTLDDEGKNEIYCRWCGDGGKLCLCDSCPKAFCSSCILRNFGLTEITRIQNLNERWNCFLCSPQPLEDLCERNGWNLYSQPSSVANKKRKINDLPNIVCRDISRGRERFPIPAFNDVDDALAPLDFVYVTKHQPGDGVTISSNPSFISCCSCTDNCKDASKCECAQLMGGFAYDENGIYEHEKSEGIYECNQRCSCHLMRCKNRVVGKGPHLKLEVFRCADPTKGWGLRCLTAIPAGTYITDYLGEVMLESLADSRGLSGCDEYFFNLDAWGRSQACQRLSDLGMKKGFPSIPKEHEVDVSALSKDDVFSLLGSEMAEMLHSKGVLDRVKKQQPTEQFDSVIAVSESLCHPCINPKKDRKEKVSLNPQSSGSSSSSAGAKVEEKLSSWQSKREAKVKAWKRASEAISDRAITETEDNNDTFTVDARYICVLIFLCMSYIICRYCGLTPSMDSR
jgi:hypothetical protein